MRKHVFVYLPKPGISLTRALSAVSAAEEKYGLHNSVRHESDPLRFILEHREEDPPVEQNRWSAAPVNSYFQAAWELGLRISAITVEYDNALLPHSQSYMVDLSGERYCNGELRHHPGVGEEIYISPVITCLPSKRTVSVSLVVEDRYNLDYYRRAILATLHAVEPVIFRTRTFKAVREAIRTGDHAAIRQAYKHHYLALGIQ